MTSSPSSTDNNNINNIKTYRHEFSKEFMAKLAEFSKVHQYDDRHTYKNEWTKWIQQEEIERSIDVEKRRLQENGYKGDVNDKMFKAGRYYFRKKTFSSASAAAQATAQAQVEEAEAEAKTKDEDNDNDDDKKKTTTTIPSQTPPPPQQQRQRRQYITMSKDTIRLMDAHLTNIHRNEGNNPSIVFKPSLCYDDFYQTQMSSKEMTTEIEKIIEKYEKSTNISPDELTNEIIDKIKKTYKNRYYKFASSLQTE
jgi:hypothetical protein